MLLALDDGLQIAQSQGSDVASSQPVLSQFRGSNMSPRIRALAFLTLGVYIIIIIIIIKKN